MKRIASLISRRRRGGNGETPADTVVVARPWRRRQGLWVAAGFLTMMLAAAAVLALREDKKKPPQAVAPGQLAVEMEQRDASATGGAIAIDPLTAETLGLQTSAAEWRILDEPVTTTGRVVADERRTTQVTTKVDGWIERTFVDFEGQQVRKGRPLFTIYSPDLVATQQEYLLALRARRSFSRSEFESVRGSGDELVEVARRRLLLWDVTPAQIDEIERTGRALKNLTVHSPASGVVTERKAFPGTRVTPEMALYTLSDISTVWVIADVFESDLANIRVGTPAEVTLPSGETRAARVTYVNPAVNPESRTAEVRLELPNPGLKILPGMYVNVTLKTKRDQQLVVPGDAVLDTGARKLVLVDQGGGQFVLREITTSGGGSDYSVVSSGLSGGERVARNIQFLVDSETELRQQVDRMFPEAGQAGAGAGGSMQNMPGVSGSGGH